MCTVSTVALITRFIVGSPPTVNAGHKVSIVGPLRSGNSIGIDLISTPTLMLCDEPTSGLSSFQIETVMETLLAIAIEGHTVIGSIHQPSSSNCAIRDDLILLVTGKQICSGRTDIGKAHFTELGFALPINEFNRTERFLELISTDYASDETSNECKQRIEKLVAGCPPPSIARIVC